MPDVLRREVSVLLQAAGGPVRVLVAALVAVAARAAREHAACGAGRLTRTSLLTTTTVEDTITRETEIKEFKHGEEFIGHARRYSLIKLFFHS